MYGCIYICSQKVCNWNLTLPWFSQQCGTRVVGKEDSRSTSRFAENFVTDVSENVSITLFFSLLEKFWMSPRPWLLFWFRSRHSLFFVVVLFNKFIKSRARNKKKSQVKALMVNYRPQRWFWCYLKGWLANFIFDHAHVYHFRSFDTWHSQTISSIVTVDKLSINLNKIVQLVILFIPKIADIVVYIYRQANDDCLTV